MCVCLFPIPTAMSWMDPLCVFTACRTLLELLKEISFIERVSSTGGPNIQAEFPIPDLAQWVFPYDKKIWDFNDNGLY